jgi:phage terminase large subunit GpA-like protein
MSAAKCSCGKPAEKGGQCQACYFVEYRAKQKAKAEMIDEDVDSLSFEQQLRIHLVKIFEKETDQPIARWTEENIVLPDGEGAFGLTAPDWSKAPEMEFIFECVKNPEVKEIYNMFSSQSSKTLWQFCVMPWLVVVRKVNGLFVSPSERLIKRLKNRMEGIYSRSPLGYNEKKGGKDQLNFGTNYINIGLATSADSLAEMPADFVDFDELDEHPQMELNPVQLARSRGRTKQNFKLLLSSTPKKLEGQGGILDYYNKSKRFAIEQQCPHCGEFSIFEEQHIQAPEEADYREIESKGLGFAICPQHGCVIDDEYHEEMVLNQQWKDLDPHLPFTYIGFHKPVWCTIFEDWSSVAATRLKTKEEGLNSYKDFFNSWCAQPIDLEALGGQVEQTEIALDKYKRKQIPADAKSLTIGIDIGVESVYCVVLAWGDKAKIYEIYEQIISWDNRDWDKVERGINHLINNVNTQFEYLGTDSRPFFVGGAIDSGYRANVVYDFCRRNPLWIPIKGRHPLSKPWIIGNADPTKKMGKQANGVKLYTLNSYHWQDVLQTAIEKPADTDGSFNLPIDFYGKYLDHLNGEVKKVKTDPVTGFEKEVWEKRRRGAINDFRDATIYGVVRGYTLDLDKLRTVAEHVEIKETRKLPKHNSLASQRRMGRNTGRR